MNKKTDFWSGLKLVFKNRNYVILALLMSLVFWLIVAELSQYSWLKLIVTASWLSFFRSSLSSLSESTLAKSA